MSGEGKCQRGGCPERDNYRGYCSIYCQDMHEVELERDEALADVKALNRALDRAADWIHHLQEGIEAYRADHHAAVDRCDCNVCAWEDEDDRRREKPDLA